jgi:hypothetical protein
MTARHECRHTGPSKPSFRHSDGDSKKQGLTCEDSACDGIGGRCRCRHNRPKTRSGEPRSRRVDDAVTRRDPEAGYVEISFPDDEVTVRVPEEPPELTPRAARALLAILVELTDVPVLDRPGEGTRDDR